MGNSASGAATAPVPAPAKIAGMAGLPGNQTEVSADQVFGAHKNIAARRQSETQVPMAGGYSRPQSRSRGRHNQSTGYSTATVHQGAGRREGGSGGLTSPRELSSETKSAILRARLGGTVHPRDSEYNVGLSPASSPSPSPEPRNTPFGASSSNFVSTSDEMSADADRKRRELRERQQWQSQRGLNGTPSPLHHQGGRRRQRPGSAMSSSTGSSSSSSSGSSSSGSGSSSSGDSSSSDSEGVRNRGHRSHHHHHHHNHHHHHSNRHDDEKKRKRKSRHGSLAADQAASTDSAEFGLEAYERRLQEKTKRQQQQEEQAGQRLQGIRHAATADSADGIGMWRRQRSQHDSNNENGTPGNNGSNKRKGKGGRSGKGKVHAALAEEKEEGGRQDWTEETLRALCEQAPPPIPVFVSRESNRLVIRWDFDPEAEEGPNEGGGGVDEYQSPSQRSRARRRAATAAAGGGGGGGGGDSRSAVDPPGSISVFLRALEACQRSSRPLSCASRTLGYEVQYRQVSVADGSLAATALALDRRLQALGGDGNIDPERRENSRVQSGTVEGIDDKCIVGETPWQTAVSCTIYRNAIISDLDADSMYQCRVRRIGWGDFSPPSHIMRTCPDVPGEPRNLAPREVTRTTILLCWDPPASSSDLDQAPVIAYECTKKEFNGDDEIIYRGVECAFIAQDLRPAVIYVFRVRAINDVGAGPYGPRAAVRTLAIRPESGPTYGPTPHLALSDVASDGSGAGAGAGAGVGAGSSNNSSGIRTPGTGGSTPNPGAAVGSPHRIRRFGSQSDDNPISQAAADAADEALAAASSAAGASGGVASPSARARKQSMREPSRWLEVYDRSTKQFWYIHPTSGQRFSSLPQGAQIDDVRTLMGKRARFVQDVRNNTLRTLGAATGGRGSAQTNRVTRIQVDRNDLLSSSFQAITALGPVDLVPPLRVAFEGEDGIDSGGLVKDWFLEVSRAFADGRVGLMLKSERRSGDMRYSINPIASAVHPDAHRYFAFFGKLLGKALVDKQSVGIALDRGMLLHLLGRQPKTVEDIRDIDEDWCRGLEWMKENSVEGIVFHTFSVTQTVFDETREIELRPGGASINVTDENKHEYIGDMVQYLGTERVRGPLEALVRGFREFVPVSATAGLHPHELQRMLCGTSAINIDTLRSAAMYTGGFNADSPQIEWFWSVLRNECTSKQLHSFLRFATGTENIPVDGLNPPLTVALGSTGDTERDREAQQFLLQPGDGTPARAQTREDWASLPLPSAHTCFNTLVLPPYPDQRTLHNKLMQAIDNSAGTGFYLT